MFEPNIIYTHGMGEYLGLLSPFEGESDMAPPSTVYTKDPVQLLRIDRLKFHALVALIRCDDVMEKEKFLDSPNCALRELGQEQKANLLPNLIKEVGEAQSPTVGILLWILWAISTDIKENKGSDRTFSV